MKVFDVLVVGGGIHGLTAAYWLAQKKQGQIALIDQFEIGHSEGSSHGFLRTSRCTYDHPDLVKIMQAIHSEGWRPFEKALGIQLFYPNQGCFFGEGEAFQKYIQAVQQVDVPIKILTVKEARKIFPAFRFAHTDAVLADHSAGLIAASAAVEGLKKLCLQLGVEILQNRKVERFDVTKDPIEVATKEGTLLARKLI